MVFIQGERGKREPCKKLMCKKATVGLERPEERALSVKKLLVKKTHV
jgi:hypothetical protein